jgi:hypothetical protein
VVIEPPGNAQGPFRISQNGSDLCCRTGRTCTCDSSTPDVRSGSRRVVAALTEQGDRLVQGVPCPQHVVTSRAACRRSGHPVLPRRRVQRACVTSSRDADVAAGWLRCAGAVPAPPAAGVRRHRRPAARSSGSSTGRGVHHRAVRRRAKPAGVVRTHRQVVREGAEHCASGLEALLWGWWRRGCGQVLPLEGPSGRPVLTPDSPSRAPVNPSAMSTPPTASKPNCMPGRRSPIAANCASIQATSNNPTASARSKGGRSMCTSLA